MNDYRIVMATVAITVMYSSIQRPSAILNCTIDEYRGGREAEGVFVVKVMQCLQCQYR